MTYFNSARSRFLTLFAGSALASASASSQVMANIGGEDFTATGLMVTERNWLVVYEPFERWTGRTIPEFFQGQEFVPSVLVVSSLYFFPVVVPWILFVSGRVCSAPFLF